MDHSKPRWAFQYPADAAVLEHLQVLHRRPCHEQKTKQDSMREPHEVTKLTCGCNGRDGETGFKHCALSLPTDHGLAGVVEVLVGNAREMRPRPGNKTDKAEARWIAERLAHGLMRPSFVPPPAIRALRDLTRTRVGLVQTRTQAKNRV